MNTVLTEDNTRARSPAPRALLVYSLDDANTCRILVRMAGSQLSSSGELMQIASGAIMPVIEYFTRAFVPRCLTRMVQSYPDQEKVRKSSWVVAVNIHSKSILETKNGGLLDKGRCWSHISLYILAVSPLVCFVFMSHLPSA